MTNKRRLVSLLLAAAVLLLVLCSVLYVSENSQHHCTGEHCSVCLRISVFLNVLEKLCLSVFVVAASFALMNAVQKGFFVPVAIGFPCSLVSHKVKLLN